MGNYSTPEAYVFNDGNSNNANSIIAMLPALLQNRGVDPSLIAMCCGNRGGAFGSNGLSDIIALIVIAAIFGNGNFGLFGSNRGGYGNRYYDRDMMGERMGMRDYQEMPPYEMGERRGVKGTGRYSRY